MSSIGRSASGVDRHLPGTSVMATIRRTSRTSGAQGSGLRRSSSSWRAAAWTQLLRHSGDAARIGGRYGSSSTRARSWTRRLAATRSQWRCMPRAMAGPSKSSQTLHRSGGARCANTGSNTPTRAPPTSNPFTCRGRRGLTWSVRLSKVSLPRAVASRPRVTRL